MYRLVGDQDAVIIDPTLISVTGFDRKKYLHKIKIFAPTLNYIQMSLTWVTGRDEKTSQRFGSAGS